MWKLMLIQGSECGVRPRSVPRSFKSQPHNRHLDQMSCPARLYPLRKPQNHRVPIPRWKLSLPDHIEHVFISYVGVEQHEDSDIATRAREEAVSTIQHWFEQSGAPEAVECFTTIDNYSRTGATVWVYYWSDRRRRDGVVGSLKLKDIHQEISTAGRPLIGLWHECFTAPVSRLETNYSGLDYLPGLARLPEASTEEHNLSTYWGAARDRIPDSAHDLFPRASELPRPDPIPNGVGQHLRGTNHANMVHIRSGQYWENCGKEEADSYEQKLEPTLKQGLRYLHENSAETGALSIQYLQNEDLNSNGSSSNKEPRKESCGAGFFANLEDLEHWAKSHASHLKIYGGALAHYKAFGDERRFRTWHEVCVINEGDAMFEYVNCLPDTGVIASVPLTSVNI